MEQILKKDNLKIVKLDANDYLTNPEEIINMFTSVFEDEEETEVDENGVDAQKTFDDFFAYEDTGLLYFLLVDNKPVSVALFSKIDDHRHLEIVGTNLRYRTFGYATELLRNAFVDISSSEQIRYITACVNDENYKSTSLHESLARTKGVKTFIDHYGDRSEWTFDVSNIQKTDELLNLL